LHSNITLETMASSTPEEIEAWAKAEGVPSATDPFIQKYLSGRDALVEQEKKQRSGWCIAAS
jgi:adenosine deaminase CECR1